jgi:hypothetical protein
MIHLQPKPHARSVVPGHEGPCIAVWRNWSTIPGFGEGGRTGFFRLCKKLAPGVFWTHGPQFHGGARPRDPFTVEDTINWR